MKSLSVRQRLKTHWEHARSQVDRTALRGKPPLVNLISSGKRSIYIPWNIGSSPGLPRRSYSTHFPWDLFRLQALREYAKHNQLRHRGWSIFLPLCASVCCGKDFYFSWVCGRSDCLGGTWVTDSRIALHCIHRALARLKNMLRFWMIRASIYIWSYH